MKLPNRHSIFPALLAVCLASVAQLASMPDVEAAGLRISPTRVLFEGRKRGTEVTLNNTGDTAATFRVSFKNMRMNELGKYENIDEPDPGQLFADKMIRYSPRQITLQPNSSQTIRLLVRKPRGLAEGEYRSHLQFLSVPTADAASDIEALEGEAGAISVGVKQVFGVSIPVVVRHGKLDAAVKINDFELSLPESAEEDKKKKLYVFLERSGERSVYGEVSVTLQRPGKDDLRVGLLRGINVFTPTHHRRVAITLNLPEGVTLDDGTLHVEYRKPPEAGGDLLAEGQLPLS